MTDREIAAACAVAEFAWGQASKLPCDSPTRSTLLQHRAQLLATATEATTPRRTPAAPRGRAELRLV